jgi:stage V sporulation protein AE
VNYLLAFIFCGFVCSISQYFLEKSKLTPGHINTSLVIIGCVLSGFGIYDKLIDIFHSGATVPIMNFGHLLVSGASEGFDKYGFIGLFKGIFTNAGAGISIAIVLAFVISQFFRIRD